MYATYMPYDLQDHGVKHLPDFKNMN